MQHRLWQLATFRSSTTTVICITKIQRGEISRSVGMWKTPKTRNIQQGGWHEERSSVVKHEWISAHPCNRQLIRKNIYSTRNIFWPSLTLASSERDSSEGIPDLGERTRRQYSKVGNRWAISNEPRTTTVSRSPGTFRSNTIIQTRKHSKHRRQKQS